jgi:hypothetical protein
MSSAKALETPRAKDADPETTTLHLLDNTSPAHPRFQPLSHCSLRRSLLDLDNYIHSLHTHHDFQHIRSPRSPSRTPEG